MADGKCEHLHFRTDAQVTRMLDEKSGVVFGRTVKLRVQCEDCGEFFWFGWYPRFEDGGRQEVELRIAPGRAPMEAPWVPGQWECEACGFSLSVNTMDVKTMAVAADRRSEPEKCPNDGELMRRVTWLELSRQLSIASHRYVARVRQLEDAWPERYAMPVEDPREVMQ